MYAPQWQLKEEGKDQWLNILKRLLHNLILSFLRECKCPIRFDIQIRNVYIRFGRVPGNEFYRFACDFIIMLYFTNKRQFIYLNVQRFELGEAKLS